MKADTSLSLRYWLRHCNAFHCRYWIDIIIVLLSPIAFATATPYFSPYLYFVFSGHYQIDCHFHYYISFIDLHLASQYAGHITITDCISVSTFTTAFTTYCFWRHWNISIAVTPVISSYFHADYWFNRRRSRHHFLHTTDYWYVSSLYIDIDIFSMPHVSRLAFSRLLLSFISKPW